jgi:hypothetical protein
MPNSFPYSSNARAKAALDDGYDWAISDFPTFERAVNIGAGPRDGGSAIVRTAGRKAPSQQDISGFLMDEAGLTPGEASRLGARVAGYGLAHWDAKTAMGVFDDTPDVITPEQDAVARRFFQTAPNNPDVRKAVKAYDDALARGRLRIRP